MQSFQFSKVSSFVKNEMKYEEMEIPKVDSNSREIHLTWICQEFINIISTRGLPSSWSKFRRN